MISLDRCTGQVATIRCGTVVGMKTVGFNNADALKDRLVGGTFGAALFVDYFRVRINSSKSGEGKVTGDSSEAARSDLIRIHGKRLVQRVNLHLAVAGSFGA